MRLRAGESKGLACWTRIRDVVFVSTALRGHCNHMLRSGHVICQALSHTNASNQLHLLLTVWRANQLYLLLAGWRAGWTHHELV